MCSLIGLLPAALAAPTGLQRANRVPDGVAIAGLRSVPQVPAFSFVGRAVPAPSMSVAVPAFQFTGRQLVYLAEVPAFSFTGRGAAPLADVPAFQFTGRGVISLAQKEQTLPDLQLAPRSITTAPLIMTGRRPQNLALTTGALQMTGRRPHDLSVTTGTLQMTGRRGSFGESAGFGQTRPGGDSPAQDVSRPGKPVFRLFRVVPLGVGGTNPFDHQDVRADVVAALNPVAVVPTPTPLTVLGVPPFEIKDGYFQVDTAALTLSHRHNGPASAASALRHQVNVIAFGNVQMNLAGAGGDWTVVLRNYVPPLTGTTQTCTVLRHSSGWHYKLNLGLAATNTAFDLTSMSGARYDSTPPTCP